MTCRTASLLAIDVVQLMVQWALICCAEPLETTTVALQKNASNQAGPPTAAAYHCAANEHIQQAGLRRYRKTFLKG